MTYQNSNCFEEDDTTVETDGLSALDAQILQSLAIWPRIVPAHTIGDPYVSAFGTRLSLHFDHRTIQSAMNMSDPVNLEFDYIRVMMGFLLFNPQPYVINMVGLGGGSLAKYCYSKIPSSLVTAIEINPKVIGYRRRFLIPDDDNRFRVLLGDGADYVQKHADEADVLLLDGFDIDGQPPQLSSQGFYDACYRHLKPGGVLVANVWGRHDLPVTRLRQSFDGEVIVVPTEHGENRAVFARKGDGLPLSPDYEAVRQVHGDRHAQFLPLVTERIEEQVKRGNLIVRVGNALARATHVVLP